MTRAVIWDFDDRLARRVGGWRHMLASCLNTHVISFGGRVVVAMQDVSSVDIYAGNLTR